MSELFVVEFFCGFLFLGEGWCVWGFDEWIGGGMGKGREKEREKERVVMGLAF